MRGNGLGELRPPLHGAGAAQGSQALAPRPEPHALETVLPPPCPAEALGAGGPLSAWEGRYPSASLGAGRKESRPGKETGEAKPGKEVQQTGLPCPAIRESPPLPRLNPGARPRTGICRLVGCTPYGQCRANVGPPVQGACTAGGVGCVPGCAPLPAAVPLPKALPVPLPAHAGTETLPARPRALVVPLHPAQDDGCPGSCRERQLSSFSNREDKAAGVGPQLPPCLPPELPGQGRTSAGNACSGELLAGRGRRHGMLLQHDTSWDHESQRQSSSGTGVSRCAPCNGRVSVNPSVTQVTPVHAELQRSRRSGFQRV